MCNKAFGKAGVLAYGAVVEVPAMGTGTRAAA